LVQSIGKLFVSNFCSTKPVLSRLFLEYIYCPIFNTDVSAKIIVLLHVRCCISFKYKIKSIGQRTETRGTPYLTGWLLDKHSFT
jgi:uncharacterized membrane protein